MLPGTLVHGVLVLGFLSTGGIVGCRDVPSAQSASLSEDAYGNGPDELSLKQRQVRVLLEEELSECRLLIPGSFSICYPESERPCGDTAGPVTLDVRFHQGGVHIPELDVSAREPVDIITETDEPVIVETIGEPARSYAGRIRCLPDDGERTGGALVNIVNVEDYLVGVVTAELHQGFHRAACRAQAIASRTYVWYWMRRNQGRGQWDLRAGERAQVYLGRDRAEQVPVAAQAARDTEGLVLTWEWPEGRRIFCAFYSSTCGGRTQPAGPVMRTKNVPPLAGRVTCGYCDEAPYYHWGPLVLTREEITEALRLRYELFRDLGPITRIEVIQEEEGGRVVRLRLHDDNGNSLPLAAENFRLAVDPGGRRMRSTWFTIRDQGDTFHFLEGRGFGHGVGLCQYGAQGMAEQGASALEILRHYYPESEVVRAY